MMFREHVLTDVVTVNGNSPLESRDPGNIIPNSINIRGNFQKLEQKILVMQAIYEIY